MSYNELKKLVIRTDQHREAKDRFIEAVSILGLPAWPGIGLPGAVWDVNKLDALCALYLTGRTHGADQEAKAQRAKIDRLERENADLRERLVLPLDD